MGNIIRKMLLGDRIRILEGFQILAVVIQKIGNPVQGNGGLTASSCAWITMILSLVFPDDGILPFWMVRTIFFSAVLPSAAKLCHKNLVINLHITFKLVNHTAISNLVPPLRNNFTADGSQRCLVRRRPLS